MDESQRIEAGLLRLILRRFAAGVTVITSVNEHGAPAGMTATAFSSVSVSPPMVLVCVDANARTRRAIEGHEAYVVNVLAADQEHIARQFASKIVDKFSGIVWEPGVTGAPLIHGALAHVECRVAQAVEAGSHIVYIGDVLAGSVDPGEPLIYYDGRYAALG